MNRCTGAMTTTTSEIGSFKANVKKVDDTHCLGQGNS